ncbi:DUF6221 family protein [Streptomyces sp. NBC_00269]|uniref:DUF6221 family protein n=1 Tax=Streptomyces sp. NBC_00269 TaxID=2975696 RepID=UPI002E28FCB0|nr:DUF6221 family protein [Streptomyces sp. NBC_00269]
MRDDLVQWYCEQLVEDERIARRATAQQRGGEAWAYVNSAVRAGSGLDIFKRTPPAFGEHVAEHDPARVLREIHAKRSYLPCTWSTSA